MSYIPHYCIRNDCKFNNHTGVCSFFVGDLYFVDCLMNRTMYKRLPKSVKRSWRTTYRIKEKIRKHELFKNRHKEPQPAEQFVIRGVSKLVESTTLGKGNIFHHQFCLGLNNQHN